MSGKVLLVPSGHGMGRIATGSRSLFASHATERRLNTALEALETNAAYEFVLLTGGPVHNRCMPDSVYMRNFLLQRLKSEESVTVMTEQLSLDTYQNCKFSLTVLLGSFTHDDFEVDIITNLLHWLRFWLTFRKLGIKARWVNSGELVLFRIPLELVFVLVHLIDPLGEGKLARLNRRRRVAS